MYSIDTDWEVGVYMNGGWERGYGKKVLKFLSVFWETKRRWDISGFINL